MLVKNLFSSMCTEASRPVLFRRNIPSMKTQLSLPVAEPKGVLKYAHSHVAFFQCK